MTMNNEVMISAQQARPLSGTENPMPELSCNIHTGETIFLTGLQHALMHRYLQLLAGLEQPGAGSVNILGDDTHQLPLHQQRQLRVKAGFVLRGGPLLSVLNGLENLKLAARYHNLGDEREIEDRARDLMDIMPVNIDDQLLPAYMTLLQRRLLAIARPLMLQPRILFVDSPFDGLDSQDKEHIVHYLTAIKASIGLTLVTASNNLLFAQRNADRVIVCDEQETLVFENWDSFSRCSHKTIQLLFAYQNIKQDA